MTRSRRPRGLPVALLATLALVLPGLFTTAAAVQENSSWAIELTSATPAPAGPEDDVVFTGTVTNLGSAAQDAPDVTLDGSFTPLPSRDAVAAWGRGRSGVTTLDRIDHAALTGSLPPGASARFTVRVPSPAASTTAAFGALPMRIAAGGAQLHTFATLAARAEWEPSRLAVVVPLTLPADPALLDNYGPARTAAWGSQVGAEGRLRRLLASTEDLQVSWAIDPVLLDPPAQISQVRPTDPQEGAAWDRIGADQRRETQLRREFAADLREALQTHPAFLLPRADPDLAPMTAVRGLAPAFGPLLGSARELAESLPSRVRTDIAWPADGRLGVDRIEGLRTLYPGALLGTVIGSAASLGEVNTPTAVRAAVDGTSVLAYDDRLSNALLALTDDPSGVRTGLAMLADSAAFLGEFPGTPRDLLIVAPRSVDPGQQGLREALSRLRHTPWLTSTALEELVTARGSSAPIPAVAPDRLRLPSGTVKDPGTGPVALTASRARLALESRRSLQALIPVRVDGPAADLFWSAAMEAIYSSRWRADRVALVSVITRMRDAADRERAALTVAPETINFFADSGVLQVTVTNDLDVAVEGVGVHITPLAGRMRISDTPDPVDVGPNSRATVRFRADALAAGDVPLQVTLTDPQGRAVSAGSTVLVRAFPTGSWIYWVIAATASLLLVAGVVRTRRRRRKG